MFLSINDFTEVGQLTLLTSYPIRLVKSVNPIKSYEGRQGSTFIELKGAKPAIHGKLLFAVIRPFVASQF
jgi:hypothetical protein